MTDQEHTRRLAMEIHGYPVVKTIRHGNHLNEVRMHFDPEIAWTLTVPQARHLLTELERALTCADCGGIQRKKHATIPVAAKKP